jgi:TonB family protein
MQQDSNDNKNQISNLPKKERTIGISKNIGQIANEKAALDVDSVFATDTKAASVNTNNIPIRGSGQAGNVVSKLVGNNYGKGNKGTGTGGAGSSVSIGQLKGNSSGGAMGHGDAGLIPSKGLEINSNSDGNGGHDILVEGGLDSDIIASIIKRYLPQIQNCYEQQLVVNQGLSGKVTVAFTIGPDGSVKNQSVAESSLNNRPTEKCILDKIHEWKFPRPRGGGTVGVKYPFLLMSSRSR